MVGPLRIPGVQSPGPRAENQHEEKEKDAGYFEKYNPAHSPKGLEKSANTFCESAADRAHIPDSRARRRPTRTGTPYSRHGHRGHGITSVAGQPLSRHAARNAQSDS